MTILTCVIMAAGIVIPFTPFGATLGLGPLPPVYFAWLTVILIAYSLLGQFVKSRFARKYGYY